MGGVETSDGGDRRFLDSADEVVTERYCSPGVARIRQAVLLRLSPPCIANIVAALRAMTLGPLAGPGIMRCRLSTLPGGLGTGHVVSATPVRHGAGRMGIVPRWVGVSLSFSSSGGRCG